MGKSVKKNYFFSLLDTVLGIAFPLITFPYVTRILSPGDIGQVQFYLNIIGYITLFTAFGIPLYGVREVAKKRGNVVERNRSTLELLVLHIILTAVGYLVVFILCLTVGKIQENIVLFGVLSLGLFFSTIGCSWFYQAMEDFEYITIRSLLVKIISLILLFTLVKNSDDILWYAIVLVCGSAGNNIFNLIRLSKYIKRVDIQGRLTPFTHVRPASKIFALNLTIGLYTQLSVFLLGFMQSNEDVGYYSMAQKIIAVVNSVVLTLSTVLLPRLSQYVGNHQDAEFKFLGDKAISFVLAISVPMCTGLIFLSKPIIFVMFGQDYYPSIAVLALYAPIIAIIGLSQVFGKSILYSTGHEGLMITCTFIGMITYLVVGVPGVKYFSIIGGVFGSLCAETAVTLSMILLGKKYHPCTLMRQENLIYILASVIMGIPLVVTKCLTQSFVIQLVIGIPIGALTYVGVLAIMRNRFYVESKNMLFSYVRKPK